MRLPPAIAGPSNLIVALDRRGRAGVTMRSGSGAADRISRIEAFVDLALGQVPLPDGTALSVTRVFAWLTWPFAVARSASVRDEWQTGAELLGSRFVETEVAAYFKLAAVQSVNPLRPSLRSVTAVTYAPAGRGVQRPEWLGPP